MSLGFNVFGPEDLDRAEGILDEVWLSLPDDVRDGPGAAILRERMARHVLLAMTHAGTGHDELKALMQPSIDDWSRV